MTTPLNAVRPAVTTPTSTAALVLAGGEIGPDLAPYAEGVPCRALLPLNGRPMLDYVLDALRAGMAESGGGRILIAGSDIPQQAGCEHVPGGASLVDTLLSGAAALKPQEKRLLVVTADIPFLTGNSVADFLQRAQAVQPTTFAYPIVPAADCRARFPGMKRTTLRVAEGEFTGGNLALLDPAFLREQDAVIRQAYELRKDVKGLARMMGPGLLLRLLGSRVWPGLLPIPVLEQEVGRLLGGATARAVITPYAEIGTDVDKPEDVEIARRLLAPPPGR